MMCVDYRHKDGTIGCWCCKLVIVSRADSMLKVCNEEECGTFSVDMNDFDFLAVYEC